MNNTLERNDLIQLVVLDFASFWLNIAGSVVSFTLVYHYRRVFGLLPANIGLSVSINTISYFIGCMVLSPVVRSLKPRYCVTISLLGMATFLYLFSRTSLLSFAYLEVFCYGSFNSLLWPSIEMWISRGKEGKALSTATGSFNISWSIGSSLSTWIAGLLVERSTYFAFGFSGFVYLSITVFLLSASAINPSIRAAQSEKVQNKQNHGEDHSTPLRFFCWINAALVNGGVALIGNIFPLYAQDVLGTDSAQTGALLIARGFSTFVMFFILGRTNFWRFNRKMILIIMACFSSLFFLASHIQNKYLFLPIFIGIGMVNACTYTMSMFHGISGSIKRSQRAAIHETVLNAGGVCGIITGGYVYQKFSFSTALLMIGIITGTAFVLELIGMRFVRKDPQFA